MNRLPTWTYRDLETSIAWVMNAAANLTDIEDDPNVSRKTRELTSDARTNLKAALMLLREIRSQHENFLAQNGESESSTG